ncbi:MAG: AAA family ATPase, partial [Saprospiraceae bacterium]|nr:AAA family ATPase [Saprospiraceae bacterium]
MIIQKLHIENFRAFTSLNVEFSEQFNIIVGDNMSGKTAILEALNVGIGS